MKSFLLRRWFLISLVLSLAAGLWLHEPLLPMAESKVFRSGIVFTVMLLMSLPLPMGDIWQVVRRPKALLLALAITYVITPLAAWGISLGLEGWMEATLISGILIASTTPCTQGSAAVWTRRAGGNDALAIVVSAISNCFCFLVMPFWLGITTSQQGVQISAEKMIADLVLVVVLPLAIGQVLRLSAPVRHFAKAQKERLGFVVQLGILTMVMIGAIQCGESLAKLDSALLAAVGEFPLMIAVVLLLHLAMLWLGTVLCGPLKIGRRDQIAVAFAGSQKTLMVGLLVATTFYGGLAALPLVSYHVGQLLVDTVIADRWRKRQIALENQGQIEK